MLPPFVCESHLCIAGTGDFFNVLKYLRQCTFEEMFGIRLTKLRSVGCDAMGTLIGGCMEDWGR